jgi:hypothetical protein
MATVNNLVIELENGLNLDYESAESLGIKFNRITEDFQDVGKRFGEFSYTFELPITKNNRIAFEFPDGKGRNRIFVGKTFNCRVFNNNELLLDGIIELSSVGRDTYGCRFYSKFTQLLDEIGDKNVADLRVVDVITSQPNENIEEYIIRHIESNYTIDDTPIQFPLIYYNVFKQPFSVRNIAPEFKQNSQFFIEYQITNTSNNSIKSWLYYQDLPPAFYLLSILEKIFEDAGWSLGGTWKENEDVRKIIIPFAGDSNKTTFSFVSTGILDYDFNPNLPNIKCVDFFKNVINIFNLYFQIDVLNKNIILETYDTMFGNVNNPYDVTNKIDYDTVNKFYEEDFETQLLFKETSNNDLINGYDANVLRYFPTFYYYNFDGIIGDKLFDSVKYYSNIEAYYLSSFLLDAGFIEFKNNLNDYWNNKLSGNKKIQLKLSTPIIHTLELKTRSNRFNSDSGSLKVIPITVPTITVDTIQKIEQPIYNETGDTSYWLSRGFKANKEISLMYYYGQVAYEGTDPVTGSTRYTGAYRDWAYVNIATGGTLSSPTGRYVIIPFASPYKLLSRDEKLRLDQRVKNDFYNVETPQPLLESVSSAEAASLLKTYFMGGTTGNTHQSTSFSLNFCEDEDLLFDTLYTKFHKKKYDRLRYSHQIKATMRMNELDWTEMQISRSILYDDELYQLISIKNYDPIRRSAEVTLLKI